MAEAYLSLEDAARYENLTYMGLISRMRRNPKSYKTQTEPRESGRPYTLVAVSCLSPKARRLYRADRKTLQGDDVVIEKLEGSQPPWYVETDLHWYISKYPHQYEKAMELAGLMREFGDYCGEDRTGFAKYFANQHDMTPRTLYRTFENYLEASAWALKHERLLGVNCDYYKILALCRKPKQSGTFPSIDPEIKALIENIWFDEKFRQNLGTMQMLYDKLEEQCQQSEVAYPSYQTVTRYINHLMDNGGHSAAYLAERGVRDWKNRYMVKGERDIKSLQVMEIVVGDVHTFDVWVKYTPPNGRPIAIRPSLIAWMEMRSRKYVAYAMCHHANTGLIKNSFAKVVRQHGAPKHILIDNGRDFANREMLGHDRKERLIFDSDIAGFYKAIGVQEVFRSLPYHAWDKIIERSFGTACTKFSKWFDSYTGTLTGSKTAGKVRKDIKGMLERGELFTLEEFYDLWDKWVTEVYDCREHRGLKDAGEQFTAPAKVFENEERYFRAAPPDSYIAMLLMKSKTVPVKSTGIRHNRNRYMDEVLYEHINGYVQIRWNPDDESHIYAFTKEGELIGEVPLAEKLNASFYADEAQVEEHKSAQNRHLRQQRETLTAYRTPFELRENTDATPKLVGSVDLTIGKKPSDNVITLPMDKQLAQGGRKVKKQKELKTDYLDKRGQAVLDKLNKIG